MMWSLCQDQGFAWLENSNTSEFRIFRSYHFVHRFILVWIIYISFQRPLSSAWKNLLWSPWLLVRELNLFAHLTLQTKVPPLLTRPTLPGLQILWASNPPTFRSASSHTLARSMGIIPTLFSKLLALCYGFSHKPDYFKDCHSIARDTGARALKENGLEGEFWIRDRPNRTNVCFYQNKR